MERKKPGRQAIMIDDSAVFWVLIASAFFMGLA